MEPKKHTILGTAGHIDHGKTALIRALTDIDTDVLKEEKERGITIELGFAYWKDNITIIDVPGHEKFVKTMVAGVSTIDLFLLVIAADDGIMPQTIEHLDILRFFGVKNGIVALNKIDLVDEEWLALVQDEIRNFLDERGYSQVPIVPVSAVTGQGVEALRNLLLQKIEQVEHAENNRPFRLNVDRSFTIRGAGTVITGTVLSDKVQVDDTLIVLPQKQKVRVRGIQVHQKDEPAAYLGQRAAINLSGVKKEEIERGSVLVAPETLEPTTEFLAVLHTASQIPVKVKKHQEVRVHLGTSELIGRITWFDDDSILTPKTDYHVRIRLEKPGVCAPGDAVLIRTVSPFYTIAGGRVLQLDCPPFGRIKKEWQTYFEVLQKGNLNETLLHYLSWNGFKAHDISSLARHFFEKQTVIEQTLNKLVKEKKVQSFDFHSRTYFILSAALGAAEEKFLKLLRGQSDGLHAEKGFNKNELMNSFLKLHGEEVFFERLLQRMLNRQQLILMGDAYFLPEHAQAGKRQERAEQIATAIRQAGFESPTLNELAQRLQLEPEVVKIGLSDLVKNGSVHSLHGQRYLHDEHFRDLLEFLKKHFDREQELDIGAVKGFTGTTRKYLIPLLEYLDQKQFTQRNGDVRVKGPMLK